MQKLRIVGNVAVIVIFLHKKTIEMDLVIVYI